MLSGWALNDSHYFNASLIKHFCKYETTTVLGENNVTETVKVPIERCKCRTGRPPGAQKQCAE